MKTLTITKTDGSRYAASNIRYSFAPSDMEEVELGEQVITFDCSGCVQYFKVSDIQSIEANE